MDKFEKAMAAFSLGQHQDVMTYLSTLYENGFTLGDAQDWIDKKMVSFSQAQSKLDSLPSCPECTTGRLQPSPVNVDSATQTGDNSKIVHTCTNCMHQIFK